MFENARLYAKRSLVSRGKRDFRHAYPLRSSILKLVPSLVGYKHMVLNLDLKQWFCKA